MYTGSDGRFPSGYWWIDHAGYAYASGVARVYVCMNMYMH